MACSFDLKIEQFDVDTTLLNVDVDEDIYMRPPPSLKIESLNGLKMVYKLKKSLYGIKHAPPLVTSETLKRPFKRLNGVFEL